MTGLERVLNAVAFKEMNEFPVVPEVFGFSARYRGVKVKDYVNDGAILASCQIETQRDFDYDAVFAFADLSVEAEALGCELSFPEDSYPFIKRHILDDINDLEKLTVPDPARDGRMPVILNACRLLRRECRDKVLIAGNVLGPLSIAGQLIGIEKLLYLIEDDPESLRRLLNFTTEVTIKFGLAILKAGAHTPIVFNPMASPLVVPKVIFKRFELPNLERIFRIFLDAGSPVAWMSTAGNTLSILPLYPSAHINLTTLDYTVPLKDARKAVSSMALNGNIKPFSFDTFTMEEMKSEVLKVLEDIGDRRGFLLGSGCEIPLESRPENLKALVDVRDLTVF